MFYKISEHELLGYRKSTRKGKKYDAVLRPRSPKSKILYVPFGAIGYETFQDLTGLNLYQTHNDRTRRANYKARHRKDIKKGYYSPGWFSYNITW